MQMGLINWQDMPNACAKLVFLTTPCYSLWDSTTVSPVLALMMPLRMPSLAWGLCTPTISSSLHAKGLSEKWVLCWLTQMHEGWKLKLCAYCYPKSEEGCFISINQLPPDLCVQTHRTQYRNKIISQVLTYTLYHALQLWHFNFNFDILHLQLPTYALIL